MSHAAFPYDDPADDAADPHAGSIPYAVSFVRAHPLPRRPRRRRGRLVLMLASAALGGAWYAVRAPQAVPPAISESAAPALVQQASLADSRPATASQGWLLDPRPVLGTDAYGLNEAAPLGPALRPSVVQAEAAPVPALAAQAPRPTEMIGVLAQVAPQRVPLPVQRPPELRQPPVQTAMQTPRPAERRIPQSTRSVFQAAQTEEPSFLETLFGGGQAETRAQTPGRQALAYAGTENEGIALTPRRRLSPVPNPSEGVAVYDITASTVTLPSGERLEAHSGLGESMDNPRHVHLRMRGATPPGTYELTEREALFHGVRALRLNPVGGPGAIYGRVGLLTHTYMLGPKGASNGCISFRDYARFLQAYLRGEIRRVVVVAGNGDEPPALGNDRFSQGRLGSSGRSRSDG